MTGTDGTKQLKKPGGAAPSVQGATYSIDLTWDYGAEEKGRIAKALNNNGQLNQEQLRALMGHTVNAARHYKGQSHVDRIKPMPAEIRREIARLDKAITEFQESYGSLSQEAQNSLDTFGLELDRRPINPAIREALGYLLGVASTIGAAADAPAKKGRLPKAVRLRFVKQLASIWAGAHGGEWPKRRHDWDSGKDYGPFHDFVCACLLPLDGHTRGMDDVIRKICIMGKKGARHG